MPELLAEDKLRQTALEVLEDHLGPVEALRFLALVRREPFDYQAWRDKALAGMSVDALFRKMETIEQGRPGG